MKPNMAAIRRHSSRVSMWRSGVRSAGLTTTFTKGLLDANGLQVERVSHAQGAVYLKQV